MSRGLGPCFHSGFDLRLDLSLSLHLGAQLEEAVFLWAVVARLSRFLRVLDHALGLSLLE